MKRRLKIMILAFTIMCMQNVFSQNKDVSGEITDTSGTPLPSVSVVIQGTSIGTASDFDGKYKISNVNANSVLVFSYLGMKSQSILVGDKSTINVVLQDDSEALSEIVIVGYGTQKKGLVTGATLNIKGEDIKELNTSSAVEGLQGITPGVNITRNNGQPGAGTKVVIRGLGTNEPSLGVDPKVGIYLDGVYLARNSGAIFSIVDLERMEVLRGPQGTLWGKNTTGGAINMVTKKPSEDFNRLYSLMKEFRATDFGEKPGDSISQAKAQLAVVAKRKDISRQEVKIEMIDEFIAWSLSSTEIATKLIKTKTTILNRLKRGVIKALKSMFGGTIPEDMYNHLVFNVGRILIKPKKALAPKDGSSIVRYMTAVQRKEEAQYDSNNHWLDKLRAILDGDLNSTQKDKVNKYIENVQDVLETLGKAGLTLDGQQRDLFEAVHVVMHSEMTYDIKSLRALSKLHTKVVKGLTVDSFNGDQKAFDAVMEVLQGTDKIEAVTALMALSQTSPEFIEALGKLEQEVDIKHDRKSLKDYFRALVHFFSNKFVSSIEKGKTPKEILDNLSDTIIRKDVAREWRITKTIMKPVNKLEGFTVNTMLHGLAEGSDKFAKSLEEQYPENGITNFIAEGVRSVGSLTKDSNAKETASTIKDYLHGGLPFNLLMPIKRFVSEVVGTDTTNHNVVALLDKVSSSFATIRKQYRQEVPNLLKEAFKDDLDEEAWSTLDTVFAKSDFSTFYDHDSADKDIKHIVDEKFLTDSIKQAEDVILKAFGKKVGTEIIAKSKQLSEYTLGNGQGIELRRNAYAINKLSGKYLEGRTDVIDELISLYNVTGIPIEERTKAFEIYERNPEGVKQILSYLKELSKAEEGKDISETARLNGVKGYVPSLGASAKSIKIVKESDHKKFRHLGYIAVAPYPHLDPETGEKQNYYVTSVKQRGTYSQGAIQSTRASYRGVDAMTGTSLNSLSAGIVEVNNTDVDAKEETLPVPRDIDTKEEMIPVYRADGTVKYYERAINPDIIAEHIKPKQNLALMAGEWASRQAEEKVADEYNRAIIDELKTIYTNERDEGLGEKLFVDISKSDEIFSQSDFLYYHIKN